MYEYASSNPSSFADPAGLFAQLLILGKPIADVVVVGYTVGVPLAIAGGAYLAENLIESLPAITMPPPTAPFPIASPFQDLKTLSHPWSDSSIYKPGDLNMASTNNSESPCPGASPSRASRIRKVLSNWDKGGKRSVSKTIRDHARDHAEEFGLKKSDHLEYAEKAVEILHSPKTKFTAVQKPGKGKNLGPRQRGDIRETGEWIITTRTDPRRILTAGKNERY